MIREVNEDFIDMTAKLTIHELDEPELVKEEQAEVLQEQSKLSEVDESIIEDKLKQMMPEIISQIKSQVSSELEQSRLSEQPFNKDQPIIEE